MTIQTNLSVSPYFDQHDDSSNYYRILFKPATAVQTRELNELQNILQSQIEKFGDVILKTGTLLDGCQASFNSRLPFVKIKDITADGTAVDLRRYIGLFARGDNAQVKAQVLDAIDGFEAQDPNLKTLYLKYLNSGANSNIEAYSENETIEIYNPDNRLYGVNVVDGSSGFSNTDTLVFLSAIEVQNTTGGISFAAGSFEVGQTIEQNTTNARAEIISVINTGKSLILRIKPFTDDLATANTSGWSFRDSSALEFSIEDTDVSGEAIIKKIIGSGATGRIETTPGGTIRNNIRITRGGRGYTIPPFVSISRARPEEDIPDNTQIINALDLRARNFLARVQIATQADDGINSPTTGFGYSMSVSDGKIYQNGHFLNVEPQSIIVSKYSESPSEIAVGFVTEESIANAAVDPRLNDNAIGSFNENAPGADRLVLRPRLAIRNFNQLSGNSQFLPIFKFDSEGNLFSQRTDVQFNKIADELARRTYEESGNYVLNPFDITTRSSIQTELSEQGVLKLKSDEEFTYLIDPGLAYINGYRVETTSNFAKSVSKAKETTAVSTALDVVYGNFVRVNEFAGFHAFTTGNLVELHSTAVKAISEEVGAVSSPSSKIGTARVRAITHESGIHGTSSAVYRLHLFKIEMQSGKNFRDVKSIYSDDGVADIVTQIDPSTGRDVAVLRRTDRNSLLFKTNRPVKNIENLNYEYRTKETGQKITQSGTIEIDKDSGAVWPYLGELSAAQKQQLIIIPENDLVSDVNANGTITASNTTLTGDGTLFGTQIQVGDFIRVGANTIYITAVESATSATYGPEGKVDGATAASFAKVYPKNVPVAIANRDPERTAKIEDNKLKIDLDISLASQNDVTVVYNQKVEDATSVSKPARRKVYVKIDVDTATNGLTGPWPLGVADAFRLRNVYRGTTTSAPRITDSFYIDSNQNENYLDISELHLLPQVPNPINSGDVLLVEFDCYQASGEGVKFVNSYSIKDNLSLSDLDDDNDNSVNILELPEFTGKSEYFDLREVLDFRPSVANTAAYATTPAAATTNPGKGDPNNLFFGANIKFPVPEGNSTFDMEFYVPRTDTILLNGSGQFEFVIGKEVTTFNPNQFPLYRVQVPPYPSLAANLSSPLREIADRKIANGSFLDRRRERFTIVTEELRKQVQGYTMEEISRMERRISVLEYFAQLSETEDQIKNLSIPSSIDSSIDRFKFGFFVDNFADYRLSDLSSPEFNSTIYGFILQPGTIDYNLPLRVSGGSRTNLSGTKVSFPYEKVNFLSQEFATVGPREIIFPPREDEEVDEPDPGPPEPPPFTRVCQAVLNASERFTQVNTPSQYAAVADPAQWPGVTESAVFTLAANTEAQGQSIDLFFNLGFGTDRIIIEQSTSAAAGFNTTIFNSAIQEDRDRILTLTDNERTELRNLNLSSWHPIISEWSSPDWNKFDVTNQDDPDYESSAVPAGFLKYIGKISVPYNIAAGRFIRVTIQKASPNHLYRICFPADEVADPIFGQGGSLFEIGVAPDETAEEAAGNFTIDGSAKSECRVSTKLLLLIQRGLRQDPCAPPKDEEEELVEDGDGEEDIEDQEEIVITPIQTIDEGEKRIIDDFDNADKGVIDDPWDDQANPDTIVTNATVAEPPKMSTKLLLLIRRGIRNPDGSVK